VTGVVPRLRLNSFIGSPPDTEQQEDGFNVRIPPLKHVPGTPIADESDAAACNRSEVHQLVLANKPQALREFLDRIILMASTTATQHKHGHHTATTTVSSSSSSSSALAAGGGPDYNLGGNYARSDNDVFTLLLLPLTGQAHAGPAAGAIKAPQQQQQHESLKQQLPPPPRLAELLPASLGLAAAFRPAAAAAVAAAAASAAAAAAGGFGPGSQGSLGSLGSAAELEAAVNAADIHGWTPLMMAASLVNQRVATSMCGTLLDFKAAADRTDRHGLTALHWAAAVGNDQVIRKLVRKKCNIDAQTADTRETALHRAARLGQAACVKTLLTCKANGMTRNVDFRGAWDVAGLFTDRIETNNETQCEQIRASMQEVDPFFRTLVLHHRDCLEPASMRTSSGTVRWEAPPRITAVLEGLRSERWFRPNALCFKEQFEPATQDMLERAHSKQCVSRPPSSSLPVVVVLGSTSTTVVLVFLFSCFFVFLREGEAAR
jgi:hypothetical protein